MNGLMVTGTVVLRDSHQRKIRWAMLSEAKELSGIIFSIPGASEGGHVTRIEDMEAGSGCYFENVSAP